MRKKQRLGAQARHLGDHLEKLIENEPWKKWLEAVIKKWISSLLHKNLP
jgi:hypothetical protein